MVRTYGASRSEHREYGIVVFGASGYTGFLTAEHIARHLPREISWAVAGRSTDKLVKVVEKCREIDSTRSQPRIEICDVDYDKLLALARKTSVLISTVGPYARYGDPAIRACAEAGTDYVDCTGETVWHQQIIRKYEKTARETGALLFPQCGFESVPSDLITWEMAQRIKAEWGAQVGDVVVSLHEMKAKPSGGTIETVLNMAENHSLTEVSNSLKPYALSPKLNPTPTPQPTLSQRLTGLVNVPILGTVSESVAGPTNAAIVHRTWGIFQSESSRSKDFYGLRFTYREFMRSRFWIQGVLLYWTLALGSYVLFYFAPARSLLRYLSPKPGTGVTRQQAMEEHVKWRATAMPDPPREDGRLVYCRASWAGSMYMFTAACMAEAAAALLNDDVDLAGGVYTPACLGGGLSARLRGGGFGIETEVIDGELLASGKGRKDV